MEEIDINLDQDTMYFPKIFFFRISPLILKHWIPTAHRIPLNQQSLRYAKVNTSIFLLSKTSRGPDPRNAWIGKQTKHAEKSFGSTQDFLFILSFVLLWLFVCFQKTLPLKSMLVIIIQFFSKSQLHYSKALSL